MPALVAIMIMVSIGTFSWSSLINLKVNPKSSSFIMLVVVVLVIYTHNLAIDVLVGVLLSTFFFAWNIAKSFSIHSSLSQDGLTRIYKVEGQLFFASVESFNRSFDFHETVEKVIIDVSKAHIWDISSVTALDMIASKFMREGVEIELIDLNPASENFIARIQFMTKQPKT